MTAPTTEKQSHHNNSNPRHRATLGRWLGALLFPESRTGRILTPLLIVSFATLYVEIVLIRWIGTEVRLFAYFQNLALIACFLGFGLGCFRAEQRKSLTLTLTALAALPLLVAAPGGTRTILSMSYSSLLSLSPDAVLWGIPHQLAPGLLAVLTVMSVIIVAVFLLLLVIALIPLGQWVGFYLNRAPNIVVAYTVNLAGSVAGLWVPVLLAAFWLPPTVWFALAFLVVMVTQLSVRPFVIGGTLLAIAAILLLGNTRPEILKTYWSPYQKLEVFDQGASQYSIFVNNTGYMSILNQTPAALEKYPQLAEWASQSHYDTPFQFANRVERVLIVGAGAGNDAAGAIRNSAKSIDAVEIDPAIYALGEQLHPRTALSITESNQDHHRRAGVSAPEQPVVRCDRVRPIRLAHPVHRPHQYARR